VSLAAPKPSAVPRASSSARTSTRCDQPYALDPKRSRVMAGDASMMGLPAARSTQMFGPMSATCVTHQRPVRGLVTFTREPHPKRHESAM
jgi:hypothetical protein